MWSHRTSGQRLWNVPASDSVKSHLKPRQGGAGDVKKRRRTAEEESKGADNPRRPVSPHARKQSGAADTAFCQNASPPRKVTFS